MPAVNVKEDYRERQENLSADSYTARRRFTVYMSSTEDGPTVARQASGVPRIGDPYPGNPQLVVTSLPTQPVQGALSLFEVVANYTIPTGGGSFSGTGNPLDAPAEIEWGTTSDIRSVDRDGDGLPLVTRAGEQFDPPITEEFHYPVLHISRNEATFDPDHLRLYKGACNADTFYGAAPGEAKMIEYTARRVTVGNAIAYWQVHRAIQFKLYHPNQTAEHAWWHRIIHQGYRARLVVGGPADTAVDSKGTQYNVPVSLDELGVKLPDGDPPQFLEFKPTTWRLVAFAPLGLE